MKATVWKGALSAGIAALAAAFGELVLPLAILLLAMIADYATGMARAWITRSFSSQVGLRGIVKKLMYPMLVAVGLAADYLITDALARGGIRFSGTGFTGMIVTVWLIINELISILENLAESGVPVPAFLVALIRRLKVAAEEKGEEENEQDRGEQP